MAGQTRTELRGLLARFLKDQRGSTAIEYAMIAVFVAIAIAVTVKTGVGPAVLKLFQNVQTATAN